MTNQEATAAVELAACPDDHRVPVDWLERLELAGGAPDTGAVLHPENDWVDNG
jgi:hypothetical protein